MQKKSFDSILVEDVISWNSIVGYLHMESSLPYYQLTAVYYLIQQWNKGND